MYGIASLIAPFHKKLNKLIQGQRSSKKWIQNNNTNFDYWFHCASLGEYEMIVPLAKKIKTHQPGSKLVLSFFSPSGFEYAQIKNLFDHKFYLPLDTKKNARKTVQSLQSKKIFWVKYDFWKRHLKAAKVYGADIYLINANIIWDQTKYTVYKKYFLFPSLSYFDKIFQLYQQKNPWFPSKTITTGDTKFDRTKSLALKKFSHEVVENFAKGNKIIIGGSTYEREENLLYNLLKKDKNVKVIIAPHQINPKRIEFILNKFSAFGIEKLSSVPNSKLRYTRVLLIDSIGLLSNIYRYASIAIVGGGWAKGLHNILEAAAFGLPILFGPNRKKQPEAQLLMDRKTAFEINEESFISTVQNLFSSDKKLHEIKETSKQIFEEQCGSVDKIFALTFNTS